MVRPVWIAGGGRGGLRRIMPHQRRCNNRPNRPAPRQTPPRPPWAPLGQAAAPRWICGGNVSVAIGGRLGPVWALAPAPVPTPVVILFDFSPGRRRRRRIQPFTHPLNPPHTRPHTHTPNPHRKAPHPETMADAPTVQIEKCPASAPFFGFMGVTAAIVFASK